MEINIWNVNWTFLSDRIRYVKKTFYKYQLCFKLLEVYKITEVVKLSTKVITIICKIKK